MSTEKQLFMVVLLIPQYGPKGGKRKSLYREYVVLASDQAEARAVFAEEMPLYVDDIASVVPCGCRVMNTRNS